jgi:hypothetical protein
MHQHDMTKGVANDEAIAIEDTSSTPSAATSESMSSG